MNVPAHIAHMLIQGHATQVRIPTGPPQHLNNGQTIPAKCPFEIGGDYPIRPIKLYHFNIEGRPTEQTHRETEDELGRIQITSITQAALTDLTYQDARREGYRASTWRDDLTETWASHYPRTALTRNVWVLGVRPFADAPRLLAHTGRPVGKIDPVDHERWHGPAGSETGYTSSGYQAMRGEPEALLPFDPNHRTLAQAKHEHAKTGDGSIADRLAAAREAAQQNGVELGYLEKALEQRLRAIERAARKQRAA